MASIGLNSVGIGRSAFKSDPSTIFHLFLQVMWMISVKKKNNKSELKI
jgi:hypothetical protein